MGKAHKYALRLDFDRKLKLEFHGTKVTSDAGLPAYRELDEALGLTSAIDSELRDNRTGKNTRHSIAALLRQSISSRLAGSTSLEIWSEPCFAIGMSVAPMTDKVFWSQSMPVIEAVTSCGSSEGMRPLLIPMCIAVSK